MIQFPTMIWDKAVSCWINQFDFCYEPKKVLGKFRYSPPFWKVFNFYDTSRGISHLSVKFEEIQISILVWKNLRNFDPTLVLVQEVQWSARLILVVTVSQASMSVSLSPPSCSQWSSSYSCEQIFIYSTTTVTTAAAIIIMHYQIDIMMSQVHHNYNRRYIMIDSWL